MLHKLTIFTLVLLSTISLTFGHYLTDSLHTTPLSVDFVVNEMRNGKLLKSQQITGISDEIVRLIKKHHVRNFVKLLLDQESWHVTCSNYQQRFGGEFSRDPESVTRWPHSLVEPKTKNWEICWQSIYLNIAYRYFHDAQLINLLDEEYANMFQSMHHHHLLIILIRDCNLGGGKRFFITHPRKFVQIVTNAINHVYDMGHYGEIDAFMNAVGKIDVECKEWYTALEEADVSDEIIIRKDRQHMYPAYIKQWIMENGYSEYDDKRIAIDLRRELTISVNLKLRGSR